MHRERNARERSASISTHGSLEHHETASLNGTPDSNTSVPQRIMATSIATVDSSPSDNVSNAAVVFGLDRVESSPPRQSREVEDLDATPRIGSTSSQGIDPTSSGQAPLFPMSAFQRQRSEGSSRVGE